MELDAALLQAAITVALGVLCAFLYVRAGDERHPLQGRGGRDPDRQRDPVRSGGGGLDPRGYLETKQVFINLDEKPIGWYLPEWATCRLARRPPSILDARP
jgi:hypothetical protein